MVYCGRPSRGCQMCRTRRIKCDETKPTCLQCQKSRRQCPGYKDDFDLVFRNETQATERRAKRATTGSKKLNTQVTQARQKQQLEQRLEFPSYYSEVVMSASSDTSSALVSPTSTDSDYSGLPVISSSVTVPGQIDTSMDVQAIHIFLSNWVMLPQQGTNRGYLDFLLPLLRTSPPESHLSLTFSAVGLAALGNRSSPGINSKGIMPYAAQKYAKALQRTNEALRDPVLAKQDSTLASVLLLGLFEQITSSRSNLMGWGSHVDGAVALIKMRGKKQLRTAVGKGLFIAVRTQMAVNCTSSSKPPLMGTDFWFTDVKKEPYGQTITRLNLIVAELRAEVNKTMIMASRTANNMEKVLGLMRRAQNMDGEFVKWEAILPPEWLPRCATWEGDGQIKGREAEWHIFPGEVESFEDLWQAGVWLTARISRLFLSGIVVRCIAWICSPQDYRETPEYATAASLASKMLTGIISAVPFNLGFGVLDDEGRKVVGQVANGDFAVGGGGLGAQKPFPRSLGGFFTLWPLFTVACSDYANDSQRRWVNGRLRWITEEMGVNQAGVLSQFQLRLPSMVIKRDGMGISSPTAKDMANNAGPTGNLPAAARPANALKNDDAGAAGVKIKLDTTSPSSSGPGSIPVESPSMASGNGSLGTNKSTWGVASQQQPMHQNQIQDLRQQQGTSYGQGQYVSPHTSSESNSQYASPGAHPIPGQEPQMHMYSNSSPSYSQVLNTQSQFQNQSYYSSPNSYSQPTNTTSPSTYSATTVTDTTMRNASLSTNTSASFGGNPNVPLSNLNQYQQQESQSRPVKAHIDNQSDAASHIDHLISITTGNNSPSHSTSYSPNYPSSAHSPYNPENNDLSPQHHYDNSMSRSPNPHYNQNPYQAFNQEKPNNMEFKVEASPTSYHNPHYISSNISDNNTNRNESYPTPPNNFAPEPTHWNTATGAQQQPNFTSRDRHTNENNPASIKQRMSLNSGVNNGTNTNDQNRLNWEIEMVGKEVAKGNELERRHYQSYLRDLGIQETI